MFENKSGVDGGADVVFQRRIGIGLLEGVELSILDVAQPWREALADQRE